MNRKIDTNNAEDVWKAKGMDWYALDSDNEIDPNEIDANKFAKLSEAASLK